MLNIKKLFVTCSDKNGQDILILKNCSFDLNPGEFHAIMGPNGSGKSSFLLSLIGHPAYKISSGVAVFEGKNLERFKTNERSLLGLCISTQETVEIPGLKILHFLKEIYSAHNKKLISLADFLKILNPLLEAVGLDEDILERDLNVGFSGGQKKRLHLLQVMLLKPKLCLLDEIDAGVDIDGLKKIVTIIDHYRRQNQKSSFIFVTHHPEILEKIKPDFVHLMINGSFVETGKDQILDEVKRHGYGRYEKKA